MPTHSKDNKVQPDRSLCRGHILHQGTRSCSPIRVRRIKRSGGKFENLYMRNGTFTSNRFAALYHTEPAPGVMMDNDARSMHSDFTFRHDVRLPSPGPFTEVAEARNPSDANVDGKVLASKATMSPSALHPPTTVINSMMVKELEATTAQISGQPRVPITPLTTSPTESTPLVRWESHHETPLAIPTESLFPDFVDVRVPADSSPQSTSLSADLLHLFFLSPSPIATASASRPRHKMMPNRSRVPLPPVANASPPPQTTQPRSIIPRPVALDDTVVATDSKPSAKVVEKVALAYKGPPQVTPELAKRYNRERSILSRTHSSTRSTVPLVREQYVNPEDVKGSDMAIDDADGEWEWIE